MGQAGVLARPRTTAEVAALVRACAEARVGVVPVSGGTGLVGGQIMTTGPAPVLLSLERMTALRGIWPQENAMVVEAGMVLADVLHYTATRFAPSAIVDLATLTYSVMRGLGRAT